MFPSKKKVYSLLTKQRMLNHFHVQEIISFCAFVVCDALRNHFLYLTFKISAKLIDVPLVPFYGWINTLKHNRKYTNNFEEVGRANHNANKIRKASVQGGKTRANQS